MTRYLLWLLVLAAIIEDGVAINCFSNYGSLFGESNGTKISCDSKFTTCFSLVPIDYILSSCGSGGGVESLVTCSTDYCNSMTPSSITCYHRNSTDLLGGNGTAIACPTAYTSCFRYTSGSLNHGTCGSCGYISNPTCTSCSTDYCNTLTIGCYTRATTSSSSNGTFGWCSSGISSCFAYKSGSIYHAGCGTCGSAPLDADCTACTSSSCNYQTAPVNCYYSSGESQLTSRKKVTCGARSCHQYSYGSGSSTLYFAGCGDCPSRETYSNCRTCYTEYCNSNSASNNNSADKSAQVVKVSAAAGVTMMLALTTLF